MQLQTVSNLEVSVQPHLIILIDTPLSTSLSVVQLRFIYKFLPIRASAHEPAALSSVSVLPWVSFNATHGPLASCKQAEAAAAGQLIRLNCSVEPQEAVHFSKLDLFVDLLVGLRGTDAASMTSVRTAQNIWH